MKRIQEAVYFINTFKFRKPLTGIVLGTGLGGLLNKCEIEICISYKDIPHFPYLRLNQIKANSSLEK